MDKQVRQVSGNWLVRTRPFLLNDGRGDAQSGELINYNQPPPQACINCRSAGWCLPPRTPCLVAGQPELCPEQTLSSLYTTWNVVTYWQIPSSACTCFVPPEPSLFAGLFVLDCSMIICCTIFVACSPLGTFKVLQIISYVVSGCGRGSNGCKWGPPVPISISYVDLGTSSPYLRRFGTPRAHIYVDRGTSSPYLW